ncbi:MAG: hypothetical protein R2747_02455 [Pyrinomonadaceae bacterium]
MGIIHRQGDLTGVPVGFYDGSQCRVVNGGSMMTNASGVFGVAIEEVYGQIPNQRRIGRGQAMVVPGATEELRNGSRLGSEALNAGLSCTFTVISAYGVAASAAAEAPTGGASTILLIASWTSMIASGIQCGDGIARTIEALANPEGTTIARADANPVYSGYRTTVDAVGIVSGGVSAAGALRTQTGRALALEIGNYMGQVGSSANSGSVRSVYDRMRNPSGPRRDLPRLPRAPRVQSEAQSRLVLHVFGQGGQSDVNI